MSEVTNMMLNASSEDYANVTALSDWLRLHAEVRRDRGCGYLSSISGRDSQWGGWKFAECELWAGALNHADHDVILDHIRQIPWVSPNEIQVFLMGQHEAFFRIWMFRDGELKQYAPTKPDEHDEDFYPAWDD